VEALHRAAGTDGEREAAKAALERLQAKLAEPGRAERPEFVAPAFPTHWPVSIFMSLCAVAMASGLAMMRASSTRRPF
jgi:predicted benzoate:H+ symporter BenE